MESLQRDLFFADYAVLVAYMLITLGIGYVYKRFASASLENYFLAGRKLPGWANGFSYAATCLNSDVAPAYVGWTVGTGLFVAWLYFSRFGLALMIGGVMFALFWRRLNLFTSPEFYELRFAGRVGSTIRVWIATRSAFIAIVAWSGAGLLGMSKVTGPVFGWSKIETIGVIVPLVLLYVFWSGYLGVVTTDVFQSVIIFLGSLFLCYFCLADFGGPVGLLNALRDGLGAGVGAEVVRSFPPIHHAELGLVAIVAWVVGTGIGYGGDVAPMGGAMEGQRILSCRSGREAAKMYVWTEVVLFLLLVVICLPGLGALAKWPWLHAAERGTREQAFGMLLKTYMPPGFLGLAIAALMASLMSTLSANLNFGAQVVTNDIYRKLIRPKATDRHLLLVGRFVLFLICGMSILVALKAESLITIAIFMLGLSSAEYAANWAQWWWWRFNSQGRLAASFGGPAIFLLVRFGLKALLQDTTGYSLTEWDAVLISITLTTVLWLAVTLLTPAQDEQALMAFYRKARPLGCWGPIREKCGIAPSKLDVSLIWTGFAISVLGAVWVGAGILAISNMYVGKYPLASALTVVAAVGGAAFGVAFRNYMAQLTGRLGSVEDEGAAVAESVEETANA